MEKACVLLFPDLHKHIIHTHLRASVSRLSLSHIISWRWGQIHWLISSKVLMGSLTPPQCSITVPKPHWKKRLKKVRVDHPEQGLSQFLSGGGRSWRPSSTVSGGSAIDRRAMIQRVRWAASRDQWWWSFNPPFLFIHMPLGSHFLSLNSYSIRVYPTSLGGIYIFICVVSGVYPIMSGIFGTPNTG